MEKQYLTHYKVNHKCNADLENAQYCESFGLLDNGGPIKRAIRHVRARV